MAIDEAIQLIYDINQSEYGFCDRGVWEDGYGPETWKSDEMDSVVRVLDTAIADRNPGAMLKALRNAKRLLTATDRDWDDRIDAAISLLESEVTPEG